MDRKVCLITGATRGLGRFLSEYFLDLGYNLILVSSSKGNLDTLISNLTIAPDQRVCTIESDLSLQESAYNLFVKVKKFTNKIDLLINNAAIQGPIGPFEENDLTEWYKTFEVNLFSVCKISQQAIPYMKSNDGGSIINISGGGSTSSRPNFSAYATSKTAIVRFSEIFAEEMRDMKININVNSIAPGAMPTDMMKEISSASYNQAGTKEKDMANKVLANDFDMIPIGKLCQYLTTEEGRLISGKLISVQWDKWEDWADHIGELTNSDLYTLRRITCRDRNLKWGDR